MKHTQLALHLLYTAVYIQLLRDCQLSFHLYHTCTICSCFNAQFQKISIPTQKNVVISDNTNKKEKWSFQKPKF